MIKKKVKNLEILQAVLANGIASVAKMISICAGTVNCAGACAFFHSWKILREPDPVQNKGCVR